MEPAMSTPTRTGVLTRSRRPLIDADIDAIAELLPEDIDDRIAAINPAWEIEAGAGSEALDGASQGTSPRRSTGGTQGGPTSDGGPTRSPRSRTLALTPSLPFFLSSSPSRGVSGRPQSTAMGLTPHVLALQQQRHGRQQGIAGGRSSVAASPFPAAASSTHTSALLPLPGLDFGAGEAWGDDDDDDDPDYIPGMRVSGTRRPPSPGLLSLPPLLRPTRRPRDSPLISLGLYGGGAVEAEAAEAAAADEPLQTCDLLLAGATGGGLLALRPGLTLPGAAAAAAAGAASAQLGLPGGYQAFPPLAVRAEGGGAGRLGGTDRCYSAAAAAQDASDSPSRLLHAGYAPPSTHSMAHHFPAAAPRASTTAAAAAVAAVAARAAVEEEEANWAALSDASSSSRSGSDSSSEGGGMDDDDAVEAGPSPGLSRSTPGSATSDDGGGGTGGADDDEDDDEEEEEEEEEEVLARARPTRGGGDAAAASVALRRGRVGIVGVSRGELADLVDDARRPPGVRNPPVHDAAQRRGLGGRLPRVDPSSSAAAAGSAGNQAAAAAARGGSRVRGETSTAAPPSARSRRLHLQTAARGIQASLAEAAAAGSGQRLPAARPLLPDPQPGPGAGAGAGGTGGAGSLLPDGDIDDQMGHYDSGGVGYSPDDAAAELDRVSDLLLPSLLPPPLLPEPAPLAPPPSTGLAEAVAACLEAGVPRLDVQLAALPWLGIALQQRSLHVRLVGPPPCRAGAAAAPAPAAAAAGVTAPAVWPCLPAEAFFTRASAGGARAADRGQGGGGDTIPQWAGGQLALAVDVAELSAAGEDTAGAVLAAHIHQARASLPWQRQLDHKYDDGDTGGAPITVIPLLPASAAAHTAPTAAASFHCDSSDALPLPYASGTAWPIALDVRATAAPLGRLAAAAAVGRDSAAALLTSLMGPRRPPAESALVPLRPPRRPAAALARPPPRGARRPLQRLVASGGFWPGQAPRAFALPPLPVLRPLPGVLHVSALRLAAPLMMPQATAPAPDDAAITGGGGSGVAEAAGGARLGGQSHLASPEDAAAASLSHLEPSVEPLAAAMRLLYPRPRLSQTRAAAAAAAEPGAAPRTLRLPPSPLHLGFTTPAQYARVCALLDRQAGLLATLVAQASAAHVELSPAQQRLRRSGVGSKATGDEAAAASPAATAARHTLREASGLLAELVGLRRAAEAMRPGGPAVVEIATAATMDGSPVRVPSAPAETAAALSESSRTIDSPPQPQPPNNGTLAAARQPRIPIGDETRLSGAALRTARSGPRHPRVSFAPDVGPPALEEADAGLQPRKAGRPDACGGRMSQIHGASAAGFLPAIAREVNEGTGSSGSMAASTNHADGWNDGEDEDMIDLTQEPAATIDLIEEPAAPLQAQTAAVSGAGAGDCDGATAAHLNALSSDRSAAAAVEIGMTAAAAEEEEDAGMVDLTASGTASAPPTQRVDLGEDVDDSTIDVDLTIGASPLRTRAAAVSEAVVTPAGEGDDDIDDDDDDDEDFVGATSGSDSASDAGSGGDRSNSSSSDGGDGEAVGGEDEASSAAGAETGGDGGDGSDDDGGALRRLFEDAAQPAAVVPVSARSGRGMLTRLAEARCRAALDAFGPWALTALPGADAADAAAGPLPPSAEAPPPLYPPSVFQSRPLSDACAVTWLCVAAEWRQVAYARCRARAANAAAAADARISGSAAGEEAIVQVGGGGVAAATVAAVSGASYLDSFASAQLRPLLFDDQREGAGSCAAGEGAAIREGTQPEPAYLRALCGGTAAGGAEAVADAISRSASLVPRFPRRTRSSSRLAETPGDAASVTAGLVDVAETAEDDSAPQGPPPLAAATVRLPSAEALCRFEAAFAASPLLARASRSSRGSLPRAISDGTLDPVLGALVAQAWSESCPASFGDVVTPTAAAFERRRRVAAAFGEGTEEATLWRLLGSGTLRSWGEPPPGDGLTAAQRHCAPDPLRSRKKGVAEAEEVLLALAALRLGPEPPVRRLGARGDRREYGASAIIAAVVPTLLPHRAPLAIGLRIRERRLAAAAATARGDPLPSLLSEVDALMAHDRLGQGGRTTVALATPRVVSASEELLVAAAASAYQCSSSVPAGGKAARKIARGRPPPAAPAWPFIIAVLLPHRGPGNALLTRLATAARALAGAPAAPAVDARDLHVANAPTAAAAPAEGPPVRSGSASGDGVADAVAVAASAQARPSPPADALPVPLFAAAFPELCASHLGGVALRPIDEAGSDALARRGIADRRLAPTPSDSDSDGGDCGSSHGGSSAALSSLDALAARVSQLVPPEDAGTALLMAAAAQQWAAAVAGLIQKQNQARERRRQRKGDPTRVATDGSDGIEARASGGGCNSSDSSDSSNSEGELEDSNDEGLSGVAAEAVAAAVAAALAPASSSAASPRIAFGGLTRAGGGSARRPLNTCGVAEAAAAIAVAAAAAAAAEGDAPGLAREGGHNSYDAAGIAGSTAASDLRKRHRSSALHTNASAISAVPGSGPRGLRGSLTELLSMADDDRGDGTDSGVASLSAASSVRPAAAPQAHGKAPRRPARKPAKRRRRLPSISSCSSGAGADCGAEASAQTDARVLQQPLNTGEGAAATLLNFALGGASTGGGITAGIRVGAGTQAISAPGADRLAAPSESDVCDESWGAHDDDALYEI